MVSRKYLKVGLQVPVIGTLEQAARSGIDDQVVVNTLAYLIALGLSSELDDLLPKLVGQGKRRSKTFLGRYQLLGAK